MIMKLAVYGHYDSRGGTSAVEVSEFTDAERARADEIYNDTFGITKTSKGGWSYDGPDGEPEKWDPPSTQDWLGWAELDTGKFEVGPGDLDEDSETWVIAAGAREDDFPDWPEGGAPLALRLVPRDSKVPEGWGHPRWEDDAFGFLLC